MIFRNPRDSLGISTLVKQMFPKHTNYLMEAFDDATSKPYGYLKDIDNENFYRVI